MNYKLIKEILDLVQQFEEQNVGDKYTADKVGFSQWIMDKNSLNSNLEDFDYEGKISGRSLESVISTLLIHLGKYAKYYSKSAIIDSEFSTQEDFIFLITLKTYGQMSKMELIKRNIQDKPTGIQIINRLINQGYIYQLQDSKDKRIKNLNITTSGLEALENQMDKIRLATNIVSGNLSNSEKVQLIQLLTKLEEFHLPIYHENVESKDLLYYAKNLL